MRWVVIGVAIAVVIGAVVASDGTEEDFPSFEGERLGYPSIQVSDRATASELCEAAHADWPAQWSGASDAVYLDEPGRTTATVCVHPEATRPGQILQSSVPAR